MKKYLALTAIDLRLALRDRSVLFFNYAFPLIFFFGLAGLLHAERSGAIPLVVTSVLVIGVLGNGLFGAGIRAVVEREQNILRRFKVTPITPVPLLVASVVTGLLLYVPAVLLIIGMAHAFYSLPVPDRPISLLLFLLLGAAAFRAIGLIVAAVANSMQESNIIVQILYMPMLFLSGVTFPASMLPRWAQEVSQFLPAAYLATGVESILTRHETLADNWKPSGALLITLVIGLFIAARLFRWEKDERVKGSAKLWVAAVLAPFVALGIGQLRTSDQIVRNRVLWRQLQRNDAFLIRNARVFVGDGRILDPASVLVRKSRIEAVFESAGPDPGTLKVDTVEGSGKTVLPGLIDVHVHLGAPGGAYSDPKEYSAEDNEGRALLQYLYCGVTAVRSTGDFLDHSLALRKRVADGEIQAAQLFLTGPLFTTAGGHGTEYLSWLPAPARAAAEAQFVRTPKSPEEAQQQVRELKSAGVDGIKAVLETGRTGMLFARMDLAMFRAAANESRACQLPLAVHTGSAQDVSDAVEAGASSIEHGSFADVIPDDLFQHMARSGISYDPTLSVLEGFHDVSAGRDDLLQRSLVRQVLPQKLLSGTRAALAAGKYTNGERAAGLQSAMHVAEDNLRRAWKAGVPLVTGSDAGNTLVFHGPAVHRELQLWVAAGIPPTVALQAATRNAAQLLGTGSRLGLVAPGYDATLLVVDGDPTREISSTERISMVIFQGERVRRAELFDPAKNPLK